MIASLVPRLISSFRTRKSLGTRLDDSSVPTREGPTGMPSQKNFEFRSSQITFDAIWDKIVV